MTEKRKPGRPRNKIRRHVVSSRMGPEALGSISDLIDHWGYQHPNEAVEHAVTAWHSSLLQAGESIEEGFAREEWNLVADVCNGTLFTIDSSGNHPEMLLAANVEDGHRLDGVGYKWFCPEAKPDARSLARADKRIVSLIDRIRSLDYPQAWSMIRAVVWFWHHDGIDHNLHPWWTIAFRRSFSKENP